MRSTLSPTAAGTILAGLTALLPAPAPAQSVLDPAGTPPVVIRIYRASPRVGHESLAQQAGGGFATVSDRYGTADFWVGGTSISGRAEVVWLEGFPSHAAVEQQTAALMGRAGFLAASDSAWRSIAAHLDGSDVLWTFHRPDLGYRPAWVTPAARVLQIITFRVKPGMEADYEAVLKTFARAYADAAVDLPWTVYQVSNGMPGPAYLMMIPMASLAKLDLDMTSMGTVASKVPDMNALMAQWARSGNSVGANLYALTPSLSRPPADFTRAGGGWWGR
jgi:hypothetical protein